MFATGQQDLNFLTHSHTPHLLWILFLCMSSEALPCRQLYTVSQTSAARFLSVWQGKEVEWKKVLPRPLRPHGKGGEQSVRSPPASVRHICGQLSPRCSLRRSAARPSSALSLRCFLPSLTWSNPKIGPKNNQKRCTPPPLHTHTHFFLSHSIYTDGVDT